MTSSYPDSVRQVAAYARQRMGGEQRAVNYYDDTRETSVAVLECRRSPEVGRMTSSTLSLHLTPNLLEEDDIRVEFLMHGPDGAEELSNIVSSAALNVIKDGWLAAPGVVYPNLVSDYIPKASVPHVMWAEPQVWKDMSSVDIPSFGTVHWLMAVPISETERRYLADNGYDALEARLQAADAHFWDLLRRPVV